MRVISGKYKGKKIDGFGVDGTRPTMQRVKESLFGMIQDKIKDSVCLDLFAGTGSLGIEAMSMGAKECYFVENNSEMQKILKKNLNGIENTVLLLSDYKIAINNLHQQFDIVFLDPPYNKNLICSAIEQLEKNDLLKESVYIVCEYENEEIKCDLKLIKEKKYGSKKVRVYENKK